MSMLNNIYLKTDLINKRFDLKLNPLQNDNLKQKSIFNLQYISITFSW